MSASLGGLDYTAADMIAFLTGHAGSVYVVDGAAVCKEAGSPKALNVALLGAACETGLLGLSLQDIQSAFEAPAPGPARDEPARAVSGRAGRTVIHILI